MGFEPLYMKDAVLSIDGSDYAAEASSVLFQPSSSTSTWGGLKPASVHTHTSTATWTCQLTVAQDLDLAASLHRLLLEREGESVAVHFEPKTGGQGIDATIVITPGQIGGNVNAFAEATVTLGVNGKPELTAAAP